MPKMWVLAFAGIVCPNIAATAQIKSTSVPIGNAVAVALAKGALTGEGARPFHVRVVVSEPENPQSPYQGTIEEWWVSPNQWRLEATAKDGMHQIIVMAGGKQTEKDEGEYFPLWLRMFLSAVNDPIPNAAAWTSSGITIDQITMPDGSKSDACARAQSKIGTGEIATDAFSNVCFDGEGRLKFFGSPGYDMEFADYRRFDKKQIARTMANDPEPGTRLVGRVELLEELKGATDTLFAPLATNDSRFRTAHVGPEQMQRMIEGNPAIEWPTVHSGNTKGKLAVYIATDSEGNVREAWPLNSDNAGLEDPVRAQVMKWKLKPAVDKDGNSLQVEGGIGFAFDTTVGDPIPVLSDEEARQLAIKTVDPKFPRDAAPVGTRYRVRIAVNEQGVVTGGAAGDTELPGTIKPPGPALFPIMMATREWRFRPFVKDGKPQYFFAELVFEVK